MKRTWTTLVGMGIATLVAACSDQPTAPAEALPCEAATTSVTVTVSGAASPVFTWEPACPVAMLLVEPPDTAQDTSDRWAVWTDEDTWDSPEQVNLIHPPVTYGVRPPGITQENAPQALQAGRDYEFILWRVLDDGVPTSGCVMAFDRACLIALHTFRR
jgi:hypothetical protein